MRSIGLKIGILLLVASKGTST